MTNPIALFVYNRPDFLRDLLTDLMQNPEMASTTLYVFSDGPRNPRDIEAVERVRAICRRIGEAVDLRLVFRKRNVGCAENVIDGVSQVLEDHPAVIVLEDDLRVSPYFLAYMTRALTSYRERSDIFSVSGFSPPPGRLGIGDVSRNDVYLSRRNASCGWGTWRDRWQRVDWDVSDYRQFRWDWRQRRQFNRGGNDLSWLLDAQMRGDIDSWAIRFSYAHFRHRAYSVFPVWSYVNHVGDDGSGTHVRAGDCYRVDLRMAKAVPGLPLRLEPDEVVLQGLRAFYSEKGLSAWLGAVPGMRRAVRRFKRRFGIRGRLL